MIVCPVCLLRNDVTVRFCRNCGLPLGAPRDPVRGTTTKRADLPSDRGTGIAAIVGMVAVVLIVGGAGLMIYRGFQSNAVTAGGSPQASIVALASVALVGTPVPSLPVEPAGTAGPGASQPGPTGEPSSTDDPITNGDPGASGDPATGATSAPDKAMTLSTWSCKTASIEDPLRGRWRIAQATWRAGGSTDRLILSLTRMSGSTSKGTLVKLAYMSPGKAASTYGVTRPVGDRAIVLTFDGPIKVGTPMVGTPNLQALETVDVRRDSSGVTHVVVGVTGSGCARLNAADWRSGTDSIATADLLLDIRR